MKAVLFDMLGVIARVQPPESMTALERTVGAAPDRFWVAYWSERPPYDRGEVTGPPCTRRRTPPAHRSPRAAPTRPTPRA
ncbi:hypothetical protein ACGFYY_30450 [Streptomyces sp. NPDC048331]|uniref:hypothetical protein n=1 Tax=Streptomyces sp. NPDC048331 TaxID=3365534 RepID=UPI003713980B